MGPVDWLGCFLAAWAAMAVAAGWYRLFARPIAVKAGPGGLEVRRRPWVTIIGTYLLIQLSAIMLGHMFARLSDPTKWWLYFMMSGGIALFFVIPALWTNYLYQRNSRVFAFVDAGFWLLAYLAMGLVFFLRS
ncbi:DUF1761 domain-containing protein [Croceicoccus mobilis]|uniref:DUF1761 domain-containing protein n=1 Tax=Croceicoccus mobilis TaxID=1703339 RepID=A0A916Z0W0_9SPHN|nr:DUF1761 domain-containing protein [Croceicoccus mobilis]GGD70507.1 hypothetical protein GCM10010990_20070 [Croceicoccus mobilis]